MYNKNLIVTAINNKFTYITIDILFHKALPMIWTFCACILFLVLIQSRSETDKKYLNAGVISSFVLRNLNLDGTLNCDGLDVSSILHYGLYPAIIGYDIYSRCLRGTPYWERKLYDTDLTVERYLIDLQNIMENGIHDSKIDEEFREAMNNGGVETGKVGEVKGRRHDLLTLFSERGNFIVTNFFHLEHFAEQLEYLIEQGKLPSQFGSIPFIVREYVIPDIVGRHEPNGCKYQAIKEHPIAFNCSGP